MTTRKNSNGTLVPDNTYVLGDVPVNIFYITDHNENKTPVGYDMTGNRIGITVHNSNRVEAIDTQSEQYARATYNNNMSGVIVHFYVDETCAWQLLPLTVSGFHAADGDGPGNRRTIAIECIMDGSGSEADKKAEDNCAKLVAALLNQIEFSIDDVYSHNHWYSAKYCPTYILPHWDEFIAKIKRYKDGEVVQKADDNSHQQLYRVRKSFDDIKSQIGAFQKIENAIRNCEPGYKVFDEAGKVVFDPDASSVEDDSHEFSLIKKGDSGNRVKHIQLILKNLGYDIGIYGADGKFGSATEKAIMNFQKDKSIEVSGAVGIETILEFFT